MVLLTTFPYLAGVLVADETWHFAGLVVAAEDGYSYLAKMRQGYEGQWLWHLTYTHELHAGGPFFLFYLVLGKACRVLGLSLTAGFQLARVVGGLFLGWGIGCTLDVFVNDPRSRKLACWIALFGGGWGWLWVLLGGRSRLGVMPSDLWVPDGYAWYATLIAPHYAFSQAFLILALRDGARFLETSVPAFHRRTALWILCCVLIHPYSVLTIGLLLGLWLLWQFWREWRAILRYSMQLVALILPSVPYLIWIAWLFLKDPIFSQWARVVQNPSPAPLYYLLGYGPFLVLTAFALLRRRWTSNLVPTMLWVAIVSLLLYVPISSQRRFLSGVEFPLAVLAAEGMMRIYRQVRIPPQWRRRVVYGLLASTAMTMLFILAGTTAAVSSRPATVFIHQDELSLYRWLNPRITPDDVVLASDLVSSHIPAYVSTRVVWGTLEPETLDVERKKALVHRFYAAMSANEQQALLCDWTVTYVVWGPFERAMGTFNPLTASYLRPVETWGEWTLWAVEDALCSE